LALVDFGFQVLDRLLYAIYVLCVRVLGDICLELRDRFLVPAFGYVNAAEVAVQQPKYALLQQTAMSTLVL